MNPSTELPSTDTGTSLQISLPSLDSIQQQLNRIVIDTVTRNLEDVLRRIAQDFKLDEAMLRSKYAKVFLPADLSRQSSPSSAILPPRARKVRKTVPDVERCIALVGNGKNRCTRHRKTGSEMCQTHINSCKYTINTLPTSGEAAMMVSIQGRQMIRHGDKLYQCPDEIGEHIDLDQLQQLGEYINDLPKLF